MVSPPPTQPAAAESRVTTCDGTRRAFLWQRVCVEQLKMPQTLFWRIWNRIMLFVCVFNLLGCPFAAAWLCHYKLHHALLRMGYLLDILLIVDVVLNLHHRYEDDYGVLITDEACIRRHYLHDRHGYFELAGSIPIDLLCTLLPKITGQSDVCPIHYFPGTDSLGFYYGNGIIPLYMSIWSALRFSRWLRLPRLIRSFSKWKIPRVSVPYMRIIKNLIILVVLAHIDACFFFLMNTWESEGIAWIDNPTIRIRQKQNEISLATQYLISIQAAMESFVYAMRPIDTNIERIFSCFEILVGSLIYGSLFGVMANFIRTLDSKAALDKVREKHQFKMNHLRKFLRQKRFPIELQKKILCHEEFVWMRGQGMNEDKLFEALPKGLRQEVCNFLYVDLLNQVPLFKGADAAFKASLALVVKTINIPADLFIFREGEYGQEMYFVRSGEFEILSGDLTTVHAMLGPGSFFGEIALFDNARRMATIKSCTVGELCVLTREDFHDTLRMYPALADTFHQLIIERKQRSLGFAQRQADELRKLDAEREYNRTTSFPVRGGKRGSLSSAMNLSPLSSANSFAGSVISLAQSLKIKFGISRNLNVDG